MKLSAQVRVPGDQPPVDRLRETMSIAVQFANTVVLPDALSPTLDTPAETLGPRSAPAAMLTTSLSGQIGPYRIMRPIGTGGMGAVYDAVDIRSGARVAVKSLLRMGPTELHRFKYEFRSMAEVGHPNLVTLYELLSQDDLWLIAMEYVGGVDLCSALRALRGDDDARRLRALIRQLVLGVSALHEHGLLHRDLKPSNVLVTPAGRVVILDFGLVAEISRGQADESPAGTPLYMSPEQCAGQLATAASDWYAVGVMLFEALTGKLPFSGGYAQIFLAKQCDEPPAPPPAPGLPAELAALIGELMRRDPERRATGARLLAWCDGSAAPAPVTTLLPGALYLGRAAERDALMQGFRATERGRTACVYLRGIAGAGKTGLVQAFLSGLPDDVVALQGRCYQHESVPFKALDSLIDHLADYLAALPEGELTPLLGAYTGDLARLFPVLQRVAAVRELAEVARPAATEQEARRKAVSALRRLLSALALRRRLVLFIDDLHWTDADSLRLLSELLAPPEAPALLLIAAYRADWPGSQLALHELERVQMRVWPELHVTRLDLGRPGEAEAHAAAHAVLAAAGLPAERWAPRLAAETGGDAGELDFFVYELALRGDELARIDPEDMSIESCLEDLLGRLSARDRDTLELIALAEAPLTVALLGRALGDPSDLYARLARLHAARLVQHGRRERAPCVEVPLSRVRDRIVAGLGHERARAAHRRLADTALTGPQPDPEFVARHLHAAGDLARAAVYADRAARAAATGLAFSRAAELYELALRCEPESWSRTAAHARALVDAGQCVEAAPLFLRAAAAAPAAEASELRLRACEQLFAVGQTTRGEEVLQALLEGTGISAPSGGDAVAAAFQAELAGLFAPSPRASGADVGVLCDALWAASRGFFIHSPIRSGYFAARSAALARAAGDERRYVRGLVLIHTLLAVAGDDHATARLRAEIDRYTAEFDDPYVVGLTAMMDGIAAVGRGRWSDALRDIEFGAAYLRGRCSAVAWECNFGSLMLMSLLEVRGELRAIALRSALMSEQAAQTGDAMLEFVAAYYNALVLLAADAPDEARAVVARAAALGQIAAASAAGLRAAMIQALCALYVGDLAGARAEAVRAAAVVAADRGAFARNQRANIYGLHGQVALALAERTPKEGRGPLLGDVAADIEALRSSGTPATRAAAAILEAGAVCLGGAAPAAVIEALRVAEEACEAADVPLSAAAVRHRLGSWLEGHERELLVARSEAYMRLQAIACPARWVMMTTPGLSPEL